MADPASAVPESSTCHPRLVWVLRAASVLILLPSLGVTVLYAQDSRLPLPYGTAIASLVLYPALLWGMRTTPPQRFGLTLAAVLGSVWVVFFAYYAAAFTPSLFGQVQASRSDIVLILGGLLFVLTFLLAAYTLVAWKLGRSTSSGRGDRLKLAGAMVGGSVWGVLVIIAMRVILLVIPGQAPAVSMLRLINTAEITYASTYEHGYSSSLADLVPPARGMPPSDSAAGLIPARHASGMVRFSTYRVVDDIVDEVDSALGREPRHAYRIEYKPGPRDEHGRINNYTVCARSVGLVINMSSYFTDESGVIRVAYEDRCPTPKDWAVAG